VCDEKQGGRSFYLISLAKQHQSNSGWPPREKQYPIHNARYAPLMINAYKNKNINSFFL
jgi:hypothetical protein